MGLDIFDKAVIFLSMTFIISIGVFYSERPMIIDGVVIVNGSFNDSSNDFLESVFNSTTITFRSTVRSTTTTTISVFVMSDYGSPVAAIDTEAGSILFNCGSSSLFLDKLYIGGFLPIRYAYMTNLNETNIGGCSGAFISHMPGGVYDLGGRNVRISNYDFVVGSKRNKVKLGDRFSLLKVNGTIIDEYNDGFSVFMDVGPTSMMYMGGCFNCSALINEYKPSLLIIDDNLEFYIINYTPDVMVGNFNGFNIDGLNMFDLVNDGDFSAYIDSTGLHI